MKERKCFFLRFLGGILCRNNFRIFWGNFRVYFGDDFQAKCIWRIFLGISREGFSEGVKALNLGNYLEMILGYIGIEF